MNTLQSWKACIFLSSSVTMQPNLEECRRASKGKNIEQGIVIVTGRGAFRTNKGRGLQGRCREQGEAGSRGVPPGQSGVPHRVGRPKVGPMAKKQLGYIIAAHWKII